MLVFMYAIFKVICLHSLKTKPFVHAWGRKSRSSVIKNRKSFHLERVFSIQWRLINFQMHRSDVCRSWNFITNVNNWAHVSFWFWKKLNFLHFLPCKEIISWCFTLKIINCNEFHSDLISLFEKLDKNIEIGYNEWHGAHLGKSKQNQEISEFKILVGTNVSHVQTV
jgi:hypothetical protein